MLSAASQLAQRGDTQLSTRHWVAAVQAEVFAGLGDLDACNRALDAAEAVHGLDGQIHNGGWLRFDGSRLAEQRGTCYTRLGRYDLAETALTDALTQRLSQRRRGSVLTDLALLGIQRGDVDQVLKYGGTALELARHTDSGWIARKLQDIQAQLAPLVPDPRIAELNDQISTLTRAA
jgi:tetratricopeptide (TPR) repeat protein